MRFAAIALAFLAATAPAVARDFSNQGLVGFARIASNARDSHGETLGGFGSGMALVPGSWHGKDGMFTGTLAMLPDRGWNAEGTTDYQARLQFFDVTMRPPHLPGDTGFAMRYRRTLLLTDVTGNPTTGLDASGVRPAAGIFPDMPQAANNRIAMDSEAVAMPGGGDIWVSDEYGPYVYRFNAAGKMVAALRPPDAFIPMRDGHESFSANSPPQGTRYDLGSPQSGRQNNQGFEGMSITPDGKHLFVMNQSALIQDLDPKAVKTTRRHVRVLDYDIAAPSPRLAHEYVVALPLYSDGKREGLIAAQSEMLALNDHQFLLLCRDSGGGQSSKRDASLYRSILTVELNGASDVAGRYDGVGQAVSPLGVLRPGITPASTSVLIDMNDNAQLNRFGLHNGKPNDANDLYEKWESMALAPAGDAPGDYFLFVGSDNDFITQDGMMAGKSYADASGANVDSLVLIYRVRLPGIRR
ncbi:MAG: uncharacterized protein JWR09_5835 [Mucilaginibacter sp.]|nr:uncharacterized protein [Mucilaginibacter sp.]